MSQDNIQTFTTPIDSSENQHLVSNNISGLNGLPHHLLETMITNIGVSVADLSKKHVVLLVFLRYFGCVFCQRSIVDIVNSLSSLIKLNCIPVFVHQESEQEADEFFSRAGMPKPLSNKQFETSQDSSNSELNKESSEPTRRIDE
ncbi:predicted protein [Naegleria gruberi]|uniref:Predicted protein n=1 Tax=Naegleria gruberi TaxID=5762 RepID=D2VXU1_NAEGR|nr:uncharacterized protein NAEGRDRAFT_73873 [Naegleria gruberi]EFC38397.1 predicted protein [Naegleria gruberi]|eukprot:XP_002671141.1 predicted protein [Naegleria gruberi strain NEG-M]